MESSSPGDTTVFSEKKSNGVIRRKANADGSFTFICDKDDCSQENFKTRVIAKMLNHLADIHNEEWMQCYQCEEVLVPYKLFYVHNSEKHSEKLKCVFCDTKLRTVCYSTHLRCFHPAEMGLLQHEVNSFRKSTILEKMARLEDVLRRLDIQSQRDLILINYGLHAVAYDVKRKSPAYVVYVLDREMLKPPKNKNKKKESNTPKRRDFRYDENVSATDQLSWYSITDLGMQTFHLVPYADFAFCPFLQETTDIYTNVLPGEKAVNKGPWYSNEHHYRNLAKVHDYAIIIKGAIYDDERPNIRFAKRGNVSVEIASHFFSVIVLNTQGKETLQAFTIPNSTENLKGDTMSYRASVDQICKDAELKISTLDSIPCTWESPSNYYICKSSHCYKTFKTPELLAEHQREVHGFSFHCDECPASFRTAKTLEVHQRKFHPRLYTCPLCDSSFNWNATAMKTHEKSHRNLKRLTCQQDNCNLVFKNIMELGTHQAVVHEKTKDVYFRKSYAQIIKHPVKLRTCKSCGAILMSPEKWKLHWKKQHKRYKCKFCSCKLILKRLKLHEKECRSKKVLDCPYPNCNKKYRNKTVLQEHVKKAHLMKQYTCPACLKKFNKPSVTLKHLEVCLVLHGSKMGTY